jgi:orotidine-5'-phosphate decarboxylase
MVQSIAHRRRLQEGKGVLLFVQLLVWLRQSSSTFNGREHMQQKLTPAERLIVGIDVKPQEPHQGKEWMQSQALTLAKIVKEVGVSCVMLESLVRGDYSIIEAVHELGLQVFADLKLCGTQETLATDGILLRRYRPEFVSFMLRNADPAAIQAFQAELPNTKLLGWTILTNRNDKKFQERNGCSIEAAAIQLGRVAVEAKMHGIISAPKEAKALRARFGLLRAKFGDALSIYTPAIRPEGAKVSNDDQDPERAMTPADAIKAGVSYLIVKRPITGAENPRDATQKILKEIES